MTQDACMSSPHHFTHLGVCYVGSNATIQISSPQHPQPATFSVPEPTIGSLMIPAVVAYAVVKLAQSIHRKR